MNFRHKIQQTVSICPPIWCANVLAIPRPNISIPDGGKDTQADYIKFK